MFINKRFLLEQMGVREILLSATVMCNIQCHNKSYQYPVPSQNFSVIDLKALNVFQHFYAEKQTICTKAFNAWYAVNST